MYMFNLSRPIESADSMADCSAVPYQTYTFQCLIPMGLYNRGSHKKNFFKEEKECAYSSHYFSKNLFHSDK